MLAILAKTGQNWPCGWMRGGVPLRAGNPWKTWNYLKPVLSKFHWPPALIENPKKSRRNLKIGVFESDFKQIPFVFRQTTCTYSESWGPVENFLVRACRCEKNVPKNVGVFFDNFHRFGHFGQKLSKIALFGQKWPKWPKWSFLAFFLEPRIRIS